MWVDRKCAEEMRRAGLLSEPKPIQYDADVEATVAYLMSLREQNRELDKVRGN